MKNNNIINATEHLTLLGKEAEDKVTKFKGVISSLSFELYGCVQAVLTPKVGKDGEIKEGCWFDVTRLKILNNTPVMDLPDFGKGYVAEGKKGAANKTLPSSSLPSKS